MRVLNDYLCTECGYMTEELLDNSIRSISCRKCKGVANKVRSVPNFSLEGVTGAFPTAQDKWVKSREQKLAQERKADNS